MLSGRDIVFLAHQRWHTHTTPVHHITRYLKRDNRVLFMEGPESVGWLLHEPPAREALRWITKPLEKIDDSFYLYHTPPTFPPLQSRSRWIAKAFNAMYVRHIKRAMRQAGFSHSVFWIVQFSAASVVRTLKPELAVYECGEEWSEYGTSPRLKKYMRELDEDLCRTVDMVMVPSPAMYENKHRLNSDTHLIPWGVTTELYGKARCEQTPIPSDIAHLPHPMIGMYGMLDGRRMHRELIVHLATKHPNWSIVLVGRCMPNLDRSPFENLRNVHFFGFKRAEELPAYCKAFDVCMIPYMVNDFTRSIMPLKLVEYLATGKPVVTTAIPALEPFGDVIRVADTIESFEKHVVEALEDGEEEAQARLARAAQFDWEILGNRKLELAAQRLQSKCAIDPTGEGV